MLQFLKKPNSSSAKEQAVGWRQNFRNAARLPDIKVVRTAFFVNFGSVIMVVMFGLFIVNYELNLKTINDQITSLDESLAKDKQAYDKVLLMYKKFQEEEKKLLEVSNFLKSKFQPTTLLLELGRSLPEKILLTSIEYKEINLTLTAKVEGAADVASSLAETYVKKLRSIKFFTDNFDDMQLTRLDPDSSGQGALIVVQLKDRGVSKIKKTGSAK